MGTHPGAARFDILRKTRGKWEVETVEDKESNVFHKAFYVEDFHGGPGIITLGGMAATVKRWTRKPNWQSTTLWKEAFGGKWDRMRDAEFAVLGGAPTLAVGTHDQGVVALLQSRKSGNIQRLNTLRIDRRKDTFIHEIEIGDLNGDGKKEIYATPSEPNRIGGAPQRGVVVRYDPPFSQDKGQQNKKIVADLGNRHAKEILVEDVDGDGHDELYVAVEALTEGKGADLRVVEPVEIRRYDANTPADRGRVVAQIDDRQCRFLTAGDFDGDGRKELVAAAYKSGLWLLEPTDKKQETYKTTSIDRNSSGFEHAALAADLDRNGKSELYVATDTKGEVRSYTMSKGRFEKEVILRHKVPGALLTWNITEVPRSFTEN